MKMRRVVALTFALLFAGWDVQAAELLPCAVVDEPSLSSRQKFDVRFNRRPVLGEHFVGERFVRTELFFGLATPSGEVSEAEFKLFLQQCVTPRFPDGYTVLPGIGHFRGVDRIPIEERAMLLILLYPDETRGENNKRIEEIRDAYKQLFQQESVLRADRCCDQVEF